MVNRKSERSPRYYFINDYFASACDQPPSLYVGGCWRRARTVAELDLPPARQYVSLHKSLFRMTNSLGRRALQAPASQKYDVIYMEMHRNLCHLEIWMKNTVSFCGRTPPPTTSLPDLSTYLCPLLILRIQIGVEGVIYASGRVAL